MSKTPLTVNGAELLRAELQRLKTVDRHSVIASIAEARSHGDLSENAEYDAAKERQSFIEGRIAEVESKLAQAQVIDPKLLDLLNPRHHRLGSNAPFEVISGYRSPKTNAMLRHTTRGVAAHSLHLDGRAIDVRLEGCDTSTLHRAALAMARGGVGFYPHSDFVHLDTGRFRTWGATPRG